MIELEAEGHSHISEGNLCLPALLAGSCASISSPLVAWPGSSCDPVDDCCNWGMFDPGADARLLMAAPTLMPRDRIINPPNPHPPLPPHHVTHKQTHWPNNSSWPKQEVLCAICLLIYCIDVMFLFISAPFHTGEVKCWGQRSQIKKNKKNFSILTFSDLPFFSGIDLCLPVTLLFHSNGGGRGGKSSKLNVSFLKASIGFYRTVPCENIWYLPVLLRTRSLIY